MLRPILRNTFDRRKVEISEIFEKARLLSAVTTDRTRLQLVGALFIANLTITSHGMENIKTVIPFDTLPSDQNNILFLFVIPVGLEISQGILRPL